MFAQEEWMTAERFTLLFNALIGLITAITAALGVWASRQNKHHMKEQDKKLDVIEKQTNGLVTTALSLAEEKGKAEGQATVLKEMSKPPKSK